MRRNWSKEDLEDLNEVQRSTLYLLKILRRMELSPISHISKHDLVEYARRIRHAV